MLERKNYIINIDLERLNEIDEKLVRLNAKVEKNREKFEDLLETSRFVYTYNSNGIEGNTLNLEETIKAIAGEEIQDKWPNEMVEAINHYKAVRNIENLAKDNTEITEEVIKGTHEIILNEINIFEAGYYRCKNVMIVGAMNMPPSYDKVPDEMKRMLEEYPSWLNYHPIIRAALLHGELVFIHPFIDGNGRTSRLMMNLELEKAGFLPVIVKKEKRYVYYDALDKANNEKDYTDFINILLEEENNILDMYLELM